MTYSTTDFIKTLFAHTTEPAYVCSFANERYDDKQPGERHLMTRLPGEIASFLKKWDRKGRGMFVCMSTIKGEKRTKETAHEIITLFADLDFNKIDLLPNDPAKARVEVLNQIKRLKYQPSIIVFSGGGFHVYWLLKEAFSSQTDRERIEDALRQLADLVAGDLPVCEVSRVLRLPGSHNTKADAWTDVEIVELHPDRRYDLDELEEWFAEQSPIMLRKAREIGQPMGGGEALDFFAEYAKKHGIKSPIDVDARLAEMMFMGGAESSIHQTQIAVTAALLNRGMPKDDVVIVVLDATRKAAGLYGSRWNWRREEKKIVGMCDTWLKKNPQEAKKKREYSEAVERSAPKLTTIEGGKSSDVAKPETAKGTGGSAENNLARRPIIIPNEDPHVQLGRAVLAAFIEADEHLINTKDGGWFYAAGIWELRPDYRWLNVKIEDTCQRLKFKPTTKLRNETRSWIEFRPELWRDDAIPWDQHGKIPTKSGLIDPMTGALEPARADHYCTWRVDVTYDPAATCPWWEIMIFDMFGDKPDDECRELVRVVQECFGCALIDKKPRSLSKALVFWGIQNLGKSGPLDVISGLFGDANAATIASVESTHGLMAFTKRRPWVQHEAFGGQWHFSSAVKAIITHEPVMINIKNGPMMTQIVRAPIFWATNWQPQFKEATKAITSRMIVIEVSRQFDDDRPVGAAAEAIRRGFSKPAELVIAMELPGVLNWAIAGLRKAKERGSILLTDAIRATADSIHRDSNLVAGFLDDCIVYDPKARMRVVDFCLAHSSWWLELKGEDRRLPTNEAIGKALKAMGDGRIGMDRLEMRDNTARYYCGIALNKRGLQYHRTAYESRIFEGKIAMATDPQREVNGLVPNAWDGRESVRKMRARHAVTVEGDRSVTVDENE